MNSIISRSVIQHRLYWIKKIADLIGYFEEDFARIEAALAKEISENGLSALLNHLRLCSAIPESYSHDTSEEKLYSKYTDALISSAYSFMGLKSIVLKERADAADVEAVANDYSFVADAKVFRLSRTAKNQKDFKVQAMDGWKRGKPFAMIVSVSATVQNQPNLSASGNKKCLHFFVCTPGSFSSTCQKRGNERGNQAATRSIQNGSGHEPIKRCQCVLAGNKQNHSSHRGPKLWQTEKITAIESIKISKEIALSHYSSEREAIMRLTHEQAIQKLIKMHKIDSRIETIKAVSVNSLMDVSG